MSRAANGIAGPPAIITYATLEADVVAGPHPSRRGAVSRAADGVACTPIIVAAAVLEADVICGPHPLRARHRGASQALLPSSPPPPVRSTSLAALTPSGRGVVSREADGVACPPAIDAAVGCRGDVVALL